MKRVDLIAKELGFGVKRTSDFNAYYYYEDENGFNKANSKGETLIVEISECYNDCKSKHSLPVIWYNKGYTKELIPNWWSVETYVTDKEGRCYGAYNPTHKPSEDKKRFVINFDWHLSATEDNFRKLLTEILRLFNEE